MNVASSARAASLTRAASRARSRIARLPQAPRLAWARGVTVLAFSIIAGGNALADEPATVLSAGAVTLLNQIQSAAQHQTYVGTFVHQQGNQVRSSRVTHVVDKHGEHEKLELMDGQAREFIRHNDDVRCFMPDSRLVLVEKRARYDSFPALLTSTPVDIEQYYRISIEGVDRVAGRTAQLVVLEARDRQRYGYRLWYDKESFLLLKAQTISEKGGAIEQVAFTDIAIGGSLDASRIKPSMAGTDQWRTETSRVVPVDLARAGWSISRPVPGFRKVMEVRRAFGGREDVGQMVYSDGLAAISIFIEPAPPPDAVEGEATKGPVNVVTERHGDFWLTIVGDAPAASIRDMARQVAFKSTH